MDSNKNPIERRRRLRREGMAEWRARQSLETLNTINKRVAKYNRQRRETESSQEREARNAVKAASWRHRKESETPEVRLARNARRSESYRQRIETESSQERQMRNQAAGESRRLRRERQRSQVIHESVHLSDDEVQAHHCGSLNVVCNFCKSRNFRGERPTDGKFNSCCRKGKVKLQMPVDVNGQILHYPHFLCDLMSNVDNPHRSNFRAHIRSYNSAVSFASMGAKLVDVNGRGPYLFKVHGQIYHRTCHLQPVHSEIPQYAQLYVIDSTQATELRVSNPANEGCIQCIFNEIDRFLRQHNRLCASYKMVREIEAQALETYAAGENSPVVSMVFRRDRRSDQRRYNAPNCNEIAMVFVNDDGEPPFERDIRVYPLNPENPQMPFININILSPNLDPMTYPLLFPYGEPGWQPNWSCEHYEGAQVNRRRVNVSMLQYKTALTAIRDEFNPVIHAGKLTQQWIVDSYLQVEANNLNFIRTHQQQFRRELYQGLADHLENADANAGIAAGVRVILPSSFEGSPRNMRERCADAMTIFAKYGPPDLFVTFTANPKWPEILENLMPGEQACDRPDIVARVYKLKLKSLMEDLTVHCVLGKSVAYVYTIEFQKRGLPHAHILIVLQVEDKFSNAEIIDRIVCAEIPSAEESPRLYEIVTRCMMHGPCGSDNPTAPCMENGRCKKNFPKEFQTATKLNIQGYPMYRRRPGFTAMVRNKSMDNKYVVPYNRYLLLKYNARINVEVCTSLRAVKYIYKYIYKGFDCANLVLREGGVNQNEIETYIDGRYISAPEAMWRLLESKMHDRSHAVIRLPVHLPNQQIVTFIDGREEEALQAARSGKTKLESWFQLNQTEPDAQPLLYTDIPHSYVYVGQRWKKRQRGENKIVARMYTVGLKEEERFYLRMLLLHVPGATGFEFLRTVDNVTYDTFKEAAFHRHLLESDEEWERCLEDAATFQMPKQMRGTFASILCYCNPTNVPSLWDKYKVDMSLDFLRNHNEESAFNFTLHEINFTLKQQGLSCTSFHLPVPTGVAYQAPLYNLLQEKEEAEGRIASLNAQQLFGFNEIIGAIYTSNNNKRYFYLDGPGGCGKTYLYSTLLSFVRGKGDTCLPFATTGIAATLLKGGRTVHSGFKLPVPVMETSVSSMRPASEEAQQLREAKLIIIDEITMLTKHGLRCIDILLREIMNSDMPFGGKVLVIGGDFRQTLPVVHRGTRVDILECCVKSSPLWSLFTYLSLTENMRSCGQNQHNEWLLNVGTGNLPEIDRLSQDYIEIPQLMIEKDNLIDSIYNGNLNEMHMEDLAKRAILAPTNKMTLEMNQNIIKKLPGEPHVYCSSDSIITDDPNDIMNYQPEFLYKLTPSGMPPHVLELKEGVIVMLIRNMDPRKGLCNGTRLSITRLRENMIAAKILSECNRGDTVLLSRIDLTPSDAHLPFKLKRRQFPIIPAYAMTINKSQGQTFEHVGIHLDEPVFSHGQLYVALSRCRNPSQVKVYIKKSTQQGPLLNDNRHFTKNIVYREVFT